MTATERAARTEAADKLCASAYDACDGPDSGVALVAVGGFGRGELAPYSDLDVVLVHDDGVDVTALAQRLWYPLWDSGATVDHSVRTLAGCREAAAGDLKVAMGLLNLRHLAGDPNLTLRLRTMLLADWRRDARVRLPELRELVRSRHARTGELAHRSVPDVKEAAGGLRDAVVLRALVATWLVDVPHVELERSRQVLLDVRDAMHTDAGRALDRVGPEAWPAIAESLEIDEHSAQRLLRSNGRRITHLSRLTWGRVAAVLAAPRGGAARRPDLTPLTASLALSDGEVVLRPGARAGGDPLLLLSAAAEAAEREVMLSPATAARLVREVPPMPAPWPEPARQLLVRLLGAGPGLLAVWETLEETGAVSRILPEWDRIRLLPHASPVHRYTVDRHVVETCIEAARLLRTVRRPDVLLVAALLHDIGKGGLVEHCRAGEPIAREIAARWGFGAADVDRIATLVRRHLLLSELATTRDPDDPATVAAVTGCIEDPELLATLATLTEADARATSAKAWTSWRAGLVGHLVRRTDAVLRARASGRPAPEPEVSEAAVPELVRLDPEAVWFTVVAVPEGARVTVVGHDRLGLLADAAAVLALQRTSVRAARAWTQSGYAVSVWDVADRHLDAAVLRTRMEAIVAGRVDPRTRLGRATPARLEPSVVVRPEASRAATVLEVRTDDRPGVVYLVAAALAGVEVEVRSAHVSTLGPQAVDVFYLTETGAGALSETRAAEAAHAVRAALAAMPATGE